MREPKEVFRTITKPYNLIIYSGAIAFLLLAATFYLGLTGINFRLHKSMGIATFIIAALHLGIVLYRRVGMKMRKGRP